MDHLTPEKRSWNMGRIKGKDTKPEVLVRSMLHRAGYRFRKNVSTLPGKPDIVLPKYKTVIFVHGCFWHQHNKCRAGHMPATNKVFWKRKFERNAANDKKRTCDLKKLGWKVIVVWECQLKNPNKLVRHLLNLLAKKR